MTRANEEISASQTPVTPAMFNVLLALVDGEKHGYAMLKELNEQTQGGVRLSTGTLYGIIGFARGRTDCRVRYGPADRDDPRRRYYRVTEA